MKQTTFQKLSAEFFGTFTLVFIGTGTAIVNSESGGLVSHAGVAISFGLTVLAMIYALGDVSGCHLNPAVTLGFSLAKRFPARDLPGYVIAQFGGALLASLLLRNLFPSSETLGATLPSGSASQAFCLELILTLILMVVILSVSTGAKEKGILAGVAIGSVIAFEAMFGGLISGASMNPARSLAPALVSHHVDSLWIYLLAPTVGAAVGVLICFCVQDEGCCGRRCSESCSS